MAKEKEVPDTAEQEFVVTLEEFLSEVPAANIESKASFRYEMKQEGYTGSKLRPEWNRLYEMHNTKPTNLSWKEWAGRNGGK